MQISEMGFGQGEKRLNKSTNETIDGVNNQDTIGTQEVTMK